VKGYCLGLGIVIGFGLVTIEPVTSLNSLVCSQLFTVVTGNYLYIYGLTNKQIKRLISILLFLNACNVTHGDFLLTGRCRKNLLFSMVTKQQQDGSLYI